MASTHVCSDCGKRFLSGKAYGGHWRSHLSTRARAAAESLVVSPENLKLPESDVSTKIQSHQELEGHGSTHSEDPKKKKTLKSKIKYSGDIAIGVTGIKRQNGCRLMLKSSEERRVVLDFDLNELPCDDMRD